MFKQLAGLLKLPLQLNSKIVLTLILILVIVILIKVSKEGFEGLPGKLFSNYPGVYNGEVDNSSFLDLFQPYKWGKVSPDNITIVQGQPVVAE